MILIYHEIRHVDPDDDGLKKHDIEDWNNVIATFGKGWDSTRARLKDILSDEFESWNCIMKTEKQLSIYDNVVPMTKAK